MDSILKEALDSISPETTWFVKKWFMKRNGDTGVIRRTRIRKISLFEPTGRRVKRRNYRNRFPESCIKVESHGGGLFSVGF